MQHRSLQHASRNPLNMLLSTFRRYTQAHMSLDMRLQQKLPLSLLRNRGRSRCQQRCSHRLPRALVAVRVIYAKDSSSVL